MYVWIYVYGDIFLLADISDKNELMTTSLIAGRFGAGFLVWVLWREFRDLGDFAFHLNERLVQKFLNFTRARTFDPSHHKSLAAEKFCH